jgi:AGZA family xanthine/uracil permease-like MFS transporter
VTFAVFPSVAQLIVIFLSQVSGGALLLSAMDPASAAKAAAITNPSFITLCGVMVVLANGFVLTAMLWGGAVAFLIDRRIYAAAATLVVCAALSAFGVIHSILPSGGIYLPWTTGSSLPYHWTVAYAALAGLFILLAQTKGFHEAAEPTRVIADS